MRPEMAVDGVLREPRESADEGRRKIEGRTREGRSSDGEGLAETKGSCGIGGDDYDWISELLGDEVGDTETDDSDDVVLVGGV
ncbi:hypothetical protein U1Q18_042937 [Sarracenia purpurea var. burkii]